MFIHQLPTVYLFRIISLRLTRELIKNHLHKLWLFVVALRVFLTLVMRTRGKALKPRGNLLCINGKKHFLTSEHDTQHPFNGEYVQLRI